MSRPLYQHKMENHTKTYPSCPPYEETMQPISQQPSNNTMNVPVQPQHQMVLQTIAVGSGCRVCNKIAPTEIRHHATCSTHCCFLLCCIFCCIPCAPCVYCMDSCRKPRVHCSNCGAPA